MLIKIADIAVINRQRKGMDPTEVAELAKDIDSLGLLHPIVIRRPHPGEEAVTGGKPYVLMVGGRRLAAHILLGRTEIEANLKDDLSPLEARIAELSENVKRVNITWQEETDARAEIDRILKELNPTSTIADRAEAVGVSKAQLSKDLTLHKALQKDPSLKAATSKGAAIRTVEFRETISARLATAEKNKGVGSVDLRSKIFTADARDFIRQVPSQSIDMVFSDLPYGIDYFDNTKAGRNADQIHSYYDDSAGAAKDLIADLVPHMVRVVKPTGWIVLFMCYEWHQWLQELLLNACVTHGEYRKSVSDKGCTAAGGASDQSNECRFLRPELPPSIWTRRGKGNHGHWPELHASNRYEIIVICNGGEAKYAKKPVENVLDYPPMSGERLHAMQKPHELCKEIIERHTVLGEKVLDVTMGSGAHLAAAADLRRDFLGCDSNPELLAPALTLVGQYFHKHTHDAIQRGKTNTTTQG